MGAGVGGLTAGALLAKAGKKVLVAEREQQAGGYARGLRRGPYEFDTGPCRIRLLKTVRAELAFYDFGEYRRLVEAAVATDPRIELLALLVGDAGLRRGEAIRFAWLRPP